MSRASGHQALAWVVTSFWSVQPCHLDLSIYPHPLGPRQHDCTVRCWDTGCQRGGGRPGMQRCPGSPEGWAGPRPPGLQPAEGTVVPWAPPYPEHPESQCCLEPLPPADPESGPRWPCSGHLGSEPVDGGSHLFHMTKSASQGPEPLCSVGHPCAVAFLPPPHGPCSPSCPLCKGSPSVLWPLQGPCRPEQSSCRAHHSARAGRMLNSEGEMCLVFECHVACV